MTAIEALKQLRAAGIKFRVNGLTLQHNGNMTAEQYELLQKFKKEIAGLVHAEYCFQLEVIELIERQYAE